MQAIANDLYYMIQDLAKSYKAITKSNKDCYCYIKDSLIPALLKLVCFIEKESAVEQEYTTTNHQEKTRSPAAPKILLSISHLRAVYTVIEVLWSWTIKVYYDESVKPVLDDAIHPKSLLLSKIILDTIHQCAHQCDPYNLYEYVSLISRVIQCPVFGKFMIDRNYRRVVSTLMLLSQDKEDIPKNIREGNSLGILFSNHHE